MLSEIARWHRPWLVPAGLGALGLVRWLPYLLSGPSLLSDDWLFARNAQELGAWATASGGLTTRPGAYVAYAVTFGVTQSATVLVALLAVLNVATAVMLWRLASRWIPGRAAAGVAGLWLLVPMTASVDYFTCTVPAALALLLLVDGVRRLAVGYAEGSSVLIAGVMLVVSVSLYEITIVLAAGALIVVPLIEGRPIRWRSTALTVVGLAAVAAWIVSRAVYLGDHVVDLEGLWRLNAQMGPEAPWSALLRAASTAGVVVVLAAAWWKERRGEAWPPGRMALGGLLVMVLGWLPAARFPWAVDGLGDRVNLAASLGVAVVWVSMVLAIDLRQVRAATAAVVACAAFAGAAVTTAHYVQVSDDTSRWLAGPVTAPLPDPQGGVFSFCCNTPEGRPNETMRPFIAAAHAVNGTSGAMAAWPEDAYAVSLSANRPAS